LTSLQFIFKVPFVVFTTIFLTSTIFAQPVQLDYQVVSFQLQSGYYDGGEMGGSETGNTFKGIVRIDDAPWIQLHFAEANLGNSSYIIIRSLKDNHWQKLSSVSLQQWQNFSAFFNGDAVEVTLYVAPADKNIFININEVIVGEVKEVEFIESICFGDDLRVPSNHPATGRILNVGCTAWIIPNGKIASAGHCISTASSVNVLQFNVPLSLSNGTIQHPGPNDQYPADQASRVFVNGGVGNDWGVFQVFPNSNTQLMPREAQQAYFTLVQDLTPVSIRITGYGVDGPPPNFGNGGARNEFNQTQQTHVGPNMNSSGTTMRYQTDTQGGNSGSPIIDEATGYAVGIHSHGGCGASGGNNNGTSFFNSAAWNAVEQGLPVELVSFTANPGSNFIELSWITATETNNQGFEIERASAEKDWKVISFVNGNGTSSEFNLYSYLDTDVSAGSYSYRLKQIDFDGSSAYSQIVNIDLIFELSFALDQNYPNPFNPSTAISYQIPDDGFVSVKVYDLLGREAAQLINEHQLKGSYNQIFDASSFSSGVYFYKIDFIPVIGNSSSLVKKMNLIK
jgi:hypothetical protein